MSVSAPCDICGDPGADHVCDRCGKVVCDDHYDEDLGYCTACAAEVRGGRDRERVPDEGDQPDGVDTYRF